MTGNRAGYNKEFAAVVLLEAVFSSDADACKKYGVTIRTLQNYRKRLATDAELVEVFARKKRLFDNAWAEKLPVALSKSLEFLAEAADAARRDPVYLRNPMVIQAVAGAMKLIADVHLTSRIIDARLTDADRSENGVPQQIPAASQSSEYTN